MIAPIRGAARLSRGGFAAATLFASINAVRGPAPAAQFEFRGGANITANHPNSYRLQQMCAAISTESGARIHAQYFPNSALGGDLAMLSQVRVGAVQYAWLSPGIFQGVVPPSDISNLGFAFKDEVEAGRVMDGPLGDFVRKEIEAKGMYALKMMWNSGMRNITSSTHPIRSGDDLAGFKIRVVESKMTVDLFRAFGASPVPMSFGELYTALQTKIVDGEDAPLATIEASRFYEVQKYLSLTNHTWSGCWMIVNAEFWKNLPSDLRDVIERNNTKYATIARRDTIALNASTADKLEAQGLQVNHAEASGFRPRLRAYFDSWARTFGPTEWGLLQNSVSGKLG